MLVLYCLYYLRQKRFRIFVVERHLLCKCFVSRFGFLVLLVEEVRLNYLVGGYHVLEFFRQLSIFGLLSYPEQAIESNGRMILLNLINLLPQLVFLELFFLNEVKSG